MLSRAADRFVGALLAFGRHSLGLMERTGTKGLLVRGMSAIHVWVYRRTGGRWGRSPGAPTLLLTSVGRKSGRPRTSALYYLPDGERHVLCGSYGGDPRNPQWVLNLIANPEATVQIGAAERAVRARVAQGAERAQLWPRILEVWPYYAHYQERTSRELPLIVLEPGSSTVDPGAAREPPNPR